MMADFVSALNGAASNGAVTVRDAGCQGMVTLRGDLQNIALRTAVAEATNADVPEQGQSSWSSDGAGVLWMSPDELMLLTPRDRATQCAATLSKKLAEVPHLAVDMSDARAMITVSGRGVRDVLAKLTPADLRTGEMPLGRVRRTRLSQVPAAFWLESEDRATVICFRSVATYVFDILVDAAAGGHVERLG